MDGMSVEYFPGKMALELYKHIGNQKGIYAWYYHPKFRKKDIPEILERWFGEDLEKKTVKRNIEIWIKDTFYSKYDLFLNSGNFELKIYEENITRPVHKGKKMSPTIGINQSITWSPNFSDSLIKQLADDREVAEKFIMGLSGLYAFFPPIYIGQGRGKKGIRDRLETHYNGIITYSEMSNEDLKGMIDEDLEKSGTDNFARRAAYCGISPDDLWFSYKIIDNGSETNLENFLNRLINPGLGSM